MTAAGRYPVETIKMMDRIIREVEQSPEHRSFRASPSPSGALRGGFTDAVARAATVAADDLGVEALVVFTESGRTARMLTSYRPSKKIIACTPNPDVLHQLQLYWGVVPAIIERKNTIDDMVLAVEKLLREKQLAISGDEVIIVMGTPFGVGAETNLIKFHRIDGVVRPSGAPRLRS
ncbi:MAG: pyruvate kinase alpha/beta domain-containing protein [Myxococcota bacterium]